jgi:hypothetical protein
VTVSTGEVVLDATAGSDAGIDVVSSEYATVAAEQTAAEWLAAEVANQIVARLASLCDAHCGIRVKVAKGTLGRTLDRPDPAIRFYLFYGHDESQSRAHAERLLKGLEAEKSAVSAQLAKTDHALLADEAGAIGLFGGRRAIWVEPAGTR